ncbi:MAG: Crp/Fnr family transcriptional regulator [Deltaproteobacteria bacterium]
MITSDDLKSIIMLSYLRDSMLNKLAEVTMTAKYSAGDYIFREGDYARYLYAIVDGKIGLELEKIANNPILIDTIGRGHTFGVSALVDTAQKKYLEHARAIADTEVFVWDNTELEILFQQDYEMGYLFMKRIAMITKTRMETRAVQLIDIYS